MNREEKLAEALRKIRDIDTADLAEYCRRADTIACEALTLYECERESDT